LEGELIEIWIPLRLWKKRGWNKRFWWWLESCWMFGGEGTIRWWMGCWVMFFHFSTVGSLWRHFQVFLLLIPRAVLILLITRILYSIHNMSKSDGLD